MDKFIGVKNTLCESVMLTGHGAKLPGPVYTWSAKLTFNSVHTLFSFLIQDDSLVSQGGPPFGEDRARTPLGGSLPMP